MTTAPWLTRRNRNIARIYRRFVELIANGVSDVDLSPLVHVADAFLLGRRRDVEPFIEGVT